MVKACFMLGVALASAACDVPERDPGARGADAGGAGSCRGVVVVETDYGSSNVALLGLDSSVLSPSLLSSASSSTGLSAPLSGDVSLPTAAAGGDLLLIDRHNAVLTWVDPATAVVRAQLPVGTGFAANPHDVVTLGATKAYVTRFERNSVAGRQRFDAGDDLLVIDPSAPRITGRIALAGALSGEDARFLPRADHALAVGSAVYVLLAGYSRDFTDSAASRLVRVDPATDAITSVLVLHGLHGCGALALSPGADQLAIACAGGQAGAISAFAIEQSGLVRVALGDPPVELARYRATELGSSPVGFSVAWSSPETLLVTTFGSLDPASTAPDDRLLAVDVGSGRATQLLASAGEPFTLGDLRCPSGCGACFVADARRQGGVVHRLELAPVLRLVDSTKLETSIGLPPRYLGEL